MLEEIRGGQESPEGAKYVGMGDLGRSWSKRKEGRYLRGT